jgi:hypothetical protein
VWRLYRHQSCQTAMDTLLAGGFQRMHLARSCDRSTSTGTQTTVYVGTRVTTVQAPERHRMLRSTTDGCASMLCPFHLLHLLE